MAHVLQASTGTQLPRKDLAVECVIRDLESAVSRLNDRFGDLEHHLTPFVSPVGTGVVNDVRAKHSVPLADYILSQIDAVDSLRFRIESLIDRL